MGLPTANVVALWLTRDIESTTYRPLQEVVIEVVSRRVQGKSVEVYSEFAEEIVPELVKTLESLNDQHRSEGFYPTFELSTDEGSQYIKRSETSADNILSKLHALTPTGFEQFCGDVLAKMGGRCSVVGRSGDGGIDFIARDLLLCSSHPLAPPGGRVQVIGQAKKYKKERWVSETSLREFVGAAMRKAHDPLDTVAYRSGILSPVIYAFWTTSDFEPSAKKYANSVGVWFLNGIALAQLAAALDLEPV